MSELFTIGGNTLKHSAWGRLHRLAHTNRIKGSKNLALLALASLILNISGVLTLWHIHVEGGAKCHDCTNCKICSTTFVNIAKTTLPQTAEPIIFNEFSETILFSRHNPENQTFICSANPRAPPLTV